MPGWMTKNFRVFMKIPLLRGAKGVLFWATTSFKALLPHFTYLHAALSFFSNGAVNTRFKGGIVLQGFRLVVLFMSLLLILPIYLRAQNSAAAFYNLPICGANGAQSSPLFIADQAHGVFILWEDARSSRLAIYCQRLDSLGHPQWQNNGLAIATTSGRQTHFSASSDGVGGVIAVWQEVTNDDGDIFAQRFNTNGQRLWGENGKEVYRGSREQGIPRVISDGAEGAYVIWHDERSGSQDLVGQHLNASGEKLWAAAGVELVNPRRTQTLGDIVAIANRGFVLAWQDDNVTPARVHAQHFDQAGNSIWSAPVWVAQSLGEQEEPRLLLETSNAGDFALHVAWLDRRLLVFNVYAQKLNSSGALLWGNSGVAAGAGLGEQKELQLLRDGAGGLFVAWEDARNDKGDLFAQRLSFEGKTLWQAQGASVAQAEQGQLRAQITSDGQGGFIAAWEDERGSGTNIYAQKINALGQPSWNAQGLLLTDHGKKNSQADALARSPDRAWIAWTDERNNSSDIFAQPLAAEGKFENVPPRILSQPALQAYPSVAYAYAIDAVDYDAAQAPTLELLAGPAWLRINQATRRLEGAPSENDLGETQIKFHAVDAEGGRAEQSFQLRVQRDTAAPQILSQPDTLALEDERYVYQINASDPDPQETLRYNLESDARWLALSTQGELAGTPLNEHVGAFAIKITVSNSKGKSAQQQFTLRAQNLNDAPRITSAPPPRATENLAYAFQFTATDVDKGDSLVFAALLKPAWLQLTMKGAATGTPTRANLADTMLTLYVADRAGARDQKIYTIPLDLQNTRPSITSAPKTTTKEDSLYLYQLVITDPDPNEKLTLTLPQAPAWLQLDTTRKQISGTPRNEHVGQHNVRLEARDRKGESAQQQFTLRVENTNDPPIFTSRPDTIAFVDSTYIYKPLAQDVDTGDRVTLSLLAAPAWLTWEAASRSLRGVPAFNDVGNARISFRVEDLSNAAAIQDFAVRVLDLGAPDRTAPASPQSLTITPPRWSAAAQFILRWQNPFDASKIAGAYYKIGAPPDSSRDGALVKSSPAEPVHEIQMQATAEGRVPVYVWLVDGRGNVDHKTASRSQYHYDHTPPQAPSALRVLTTNGSNWSRGDTISFVWRPASDALSGMASYTFNIDDKTAAQIASADTSFMLLAALKEGAHTCQVAATDSAGNRRSSQRVIFRVDNTSPRVTHTPRDTTRLGQIMTLRARATDAGSGVASACVRYRAAGQSRFNELVMKLESGEFVAVLESAQIHSAGFEYIISASDSAGNAALSTQIFHAIVVGSEGISAPSATRGAYYQLVSIPYVIAQDSMLAWLHDDLGAYEPTSWRLYSYNATHGNVEFGREEFLLPAPGRAFWLITSEPKNFDLGPAHSISTAQDFVLELLPGWNLIATPFAFPTDWTAAQKPSFVESQLWAFDGKQYLGNNSIMQPWQGYFVRNLSSSPETILIPPRCGDCDAALGFANAPTPPEPPSRGELLGSLRANSLPTFREGQGGVIPDKRTSKMDDKITHDPLQWQIQLRVSNGEFADHENWLGVSASANDEWDELEWSEPPPALGDFVALRFNHKQWQRFGGYFTTDFRPPSLHAQKWSFEILSATEGQRAQLWLERRGDIQAEKIFILEEEETGGARAITFDTQTNASLPIALRSGKTPRRFVLWAGSKAQFEERGVVALTTPKQFALSPSYPNPARWQGHREAISTFRFSVPQASTVELRVYDVLGRQVRGLLIKQFHEPGHYEILWDGKDDHGSAVSTGVYLYRMTAANFHATQKIIVLKE